MIPRAEVRPLGREDLREFLALTDEDPVVNVFAAYRARTTRLDPRWLGGEVWGRFEGGRLVSALHIGANLVPVQMPPEHVESFVEPALTGRRTVSTIVGPATSVEPLWEAVQGRWSRPREVRRAQPHMELQGPPRGEVDPQVRRSTPADLEVVYPACVAMYTEEVGLSPEAGGGGALYRARVTQLISRGWQFARFEEGRVVFKAEVACTSPHAAQVQGVYVVPDRRGEGLATRGMAAVGAMVRHDIAPVASLYVNDFNHAARRSYEKSGFVETDRFTTVLF